MLSPSVTVVSLHLFIYYMNRTPSTKKQEKRERDRQTCESLPRNEVSCCSRCLSFNLWVSLGLYLTAHALTVCDRGFIAVCTCLLAMAANTICDIENCLF